MEELVFDNVSLVYEKDGRRICALEDLSFTVSQGESVAIIGPSGCGKSSLLRMACGLQKPTSGCVRIDGRQVDAPGNDTALIPQDFGLLPWKNVQANAELGLKIRHVARDERRRRARCALSSLGLDEFASAYPNELSGGMRQRLALARALALDVGLMLLDEPLSALDSLLREQIQDMLLNLWRSKDYAQVMVTHSIEEAVFLGQRILIMDDRPGKIIAEIVNDQVATDSFRQSAAFHGLCDDIRSLLAKHAADRTNKACSSEVNRLYE